MYAIYHLSQSCTIVFVLSAEKENVFYFPNLTYLTVMYWYDSINKLLILLVVSISIYLLSICINLLFFNILQQTTLTWSSRSIFLMELNMMLRHFHMETASNQKQLHQNQRKHSKYAAYPL